LSYNFAPLLWGGDRGGTGDRQDIRFYSCPLKNMSSGFSHLAGQNEPHRNAEFQKLSRYPETEHAYNVVRPNLCSTYFQKSVLGDGRSGSCQSKNQAQFVAHQRYALSALPL